MRQPAVADRFYPGSPKALEIAVTELLPTAPSTKEKALAVVSPHAGYVYSGELAAKTIASVEIPETVIIIGTNHRGVGAPVALSTNTWQMPFGQVPVDPEISTLLLARSSHIVQDELAHIHEHSLEVQIPFLQQIQKRLSIIPLVVSQISCPLCQEIAQSIAHAVKLSGKKVLFVASTDMNHYESREISTKKDNIALKHIADLEPEKLYRAVQDNAISMCGVIPVTITLFAAKILGATTAKLIGYTDSGYVSGDTEQVVGYAGLTIS